VRLKSPVSRYGAPPAPAAQGSPGIGSARSSMRPPLQRATAAQLRVATANRVVSANALEANAAQGRRQHRRRVEQPIYRSRSRNKGRTYRAHRQMRRCKRQLVRGGGAEHPAANGARATHSVAALETHHRQGFRAVIGNLWPLHGGAADRSDGRPHPRRRWQSDGWPTKRGTLHARPWEAPGLCIDTDNRVSTSTIRQKPRSASCGRISAGESEVAEPAPPGRQRHTLGIVVHHPGLQRPFGWPRFRRAWRMTDGDQYPARTSGQPPGRFSDRPPISAQSD